MHSIGAFAIILDEELRVLLCHRTDRDAWNLPGGRVEENESPWEAALREVEEEVGLVVRIERLLGIYSMPEEKTIACTFLCVKTGGALRLSNEADDIRWFNKEDLPATTLPRHVERITDALTASAAVFMRVQVQPRTQDEGPQKARPSS